VHGGAGSWPEELRDAAQAGLQKALAAGFEAADDPLEMACAAARALEDDPLFNAGVGASLTSAGTVELDAGVMRGADLAAGGVASVRLVRHPVDAARAVMEKTRHVLLVGPSADEFARENGCETVPDPEVFVVDRRRQQLEGWRSGDTIGAVAWSDGRCAAACSTGGYTGKLPGRVGDSPLPGAGLYADDALGAACGTGVGENFMRLLLAYQACRLLADSGAQAAAEGAIALLAERLDGRGGIITVDREGRPGAAFNTAFMPWAARSA
jgi:L-asparaginase / beta-aspartyl-peptidase